MTAIFVGLPVTDLERSKAFYKAVTDGIAAGAAEPRPAADYGFMYQRGLTDPDGNAIEFGWFDPAAADTPAIENQQA